MLVWFSELEVASEGAILAVLELASPFLRTAWARRNATAAQLALWLRIRCCLGVGFWRDVGL